MAKRVTSIVAKLRKAIATAERRGVSRYRIAKLAGIVQSQVHRIADGERVPTLDTAARIAAAIGYRLALLPMVAKRRVAA
jgi:DNA-binding phage protein